jgi:glycosyltransferase involved in cell wall biosynthesis
MNILMVARSLPMHVSGGMESAAWDLARHLARAGHKTSLITTAHERLAECSVIDGVEVSCVAAAPGRYSKAWWTGSTELFKTRYAETADVVLGVSAAANALVAHRNPRRPQAFVFQAHGTSSGEIVSKLRQRSLKGYVGMTRNLYWLLFKDRIYREFDAVVAIGDAVQSQMANWPTKSLLGSTPAVMISNGVDTGQFRFDGAARAKLRTDLSLPPEARVLLSLCRLHPQKGLQVGLQAFRQALDADPALRYLIAGEGPQTEALKSMISALGLEDKALLLGGVPRAAVPAHLSAADAFLFPTLRVEGLPITLLEALASGLPVITTPNGGDAELPCARAPAGDAGATCREILTAVRGPIQRVSALPERYTLDYSGRRYIELFQQILAGRMPGPDQRGVS